MLSTSSSHTFGEQIAENIAGKIRDGLLLPGARLPSVRACAKQQSVSPHTVVAAYDLLVARGWVEARAQRGFFVRDTSSSLRYQRAARMLEAERDSSRGRLPQANALVRSLFASHPVRGQPGAGVLPAAWLQNSFLASALRNVASGPALAASTFEYGNPAGSEVLRKVLAERFEGLGLSVDPQQIITTQGAAQALDIASRTLLKPGDAVLVEEPGWSVEFARLAALGMRLLPVPRGPDGPDLQVMDHLCRQYQPRMLVSVSVLHNPTGYCLSPRNAHRILQLAVEHDFWVVEDDTYGILAPAHATRITALDGLQRSIYVGGFSKALAPAWRVGYMVAPKILVEPLLDTKMLAALTTPSLFESAIAQCIELGQLRRHSDRLKEKLEVARARCSRLVKDHDFSFASEPAGMFGWIESGVDSESLAQRVFDLGWLAAPGALFSASNEPSTRFRINFANAQDVNFWRDLTIARESVVAA